MLKPNERVMEDCKTSLESARNEDLMEFAVEHW